MYARDESVCWALMWGFLVLKLRFIARACSSHEATGTNSSDCVVRVFAVKVSFLRHFGNSNRT